MKKSKFLGWLSVGLIGITLTYTPLYAQEESSTESSAINPSTTETTSTQANLSETTATADSATNKTQETADTEKEETTTSTETKTPEVPVASQPVIKEVPTQAMYRVYNYNSGEHFFTANSYEASQLAKLGWHYEGIAWYAPLEGEPVYRLYNPNNGDHHYTLSGGEKAWLAQHGWRYEGIGWYSDNQKRIPLYRSYNPNAKSGSHHYTQSLGEHNHLLNHGWRNENIAWYASNVTPSSNQHEQLKQISVTTAIFHHIQLAGDTVIQTSPNTSAPAIANSASYRGLVAITRQKVSNYDGLWYAVAFPDDQIGWIRTQYLAAYRDNDYYLYTTGGPYPNLAAYPNVNVEINYTAKRLYLKSGNRVIYTMLSQHAMPGMLSPTGHYSINAYRARRFWWMGGGADYAAGWKDYGLYLIHSTPIATPNGGYKHEIGMKLGVPGPGTSHGCIQVSVEDAKWFYSHIQTGTPVYIHY